MSGAQRREQLLDVAKAIVEDQGFHAVSIEGVARRAGITRPIVYGHFGDLAGLLEAMLDRETARALGQLAAILPTDLVARDPRDALLAAFTGYLEVVGADPVTWRLVLMPPEGAPALLREKITEGREAVIATLAQVVGPGLTPGRASPDPPLTARTLSALADESARLMLTDPEQFPAERLVAHARWLIDQLSGGPLVS
jgi:AcrR family transcriptional regulator